jgi:hypothetical protein
MQTYKEYAPTQFDSKGLGLDDRQDWFVAPVSQTRDSEVLSRVNFKSALESLGGESETVEVHRFGHWGPGWFEIILVHPSRESEVAELESTLEDYPVLDDSALSEAENNEYYENWTQHGAASDFAKDLKREFGLSDTVSDWLTYDCDRDRLLEFFESLIPSGDYHDSDCWPRTKYAADDCTREQLARFVRENRKVKTA